jgi:hypothetical protein
MRYVESLVEYKVYTYGWLQRPNGTWVCLPRDDSQAKQAMVWADLVSKSMRKATLHGIVLGKSLRTFKPPHNTTGTLIVLLQGGNNYAVQEQKNANHLKAKKFSAYVKEEICILYFFYYNDPAEEPAPASRPDQSAKAKDSPKTPSGSMEVDKESKKRDGPETRTIVMAPERKRQKVCLGKKEFEFLRSWYNESNRSKLIWRDYADGWKNGYGLMTSTTRSFLQQHRERERATLPALVNIQYKIDGPAQACLRTARIFKVDEATSNIDENDITPDMWDNVDAADHAELQQFVAEHAFKKTHRSQIASDMVVIGARWVRKWKRNPDVSYKIKSRLCATGFRSIDHEIYHCDATISTTLSKSSCLRSGARSGVLGRGRSLSERVHLP